MGANFKCLVSNGGGGGDCIVNGDVGRAIDVVVRQQAEAAANERMMAR